MSWTGKQLKRRGILESRGFMTAMDSENQTAVIYVRLTEQLKRRVKSLADHRGLSMNNACLLAIESAVINHEERMEADAKATG